MIRHIRPASLHFMVEGRLAYVRIERERSIADR